MKESGVLAAITWAVSMAAFMPLAGSVTTNSAPKARRRILRSMDMDAGMVRMSLYPFAAAMNASAIPVLPEVGSTSVVLPGVIFPLASAASTMAKPILSFTLEHGSIDSSFRMTVHLQDERSQSTVRASLLCAAGR